MKKFFPLIAFFILNFSALAIGGLFTKDAVVSDWYLSANKAPWTPPGWFFGFAWTSIMIFFSFFMTNKYNQPNVNKKRLLLLFGIQWLLNILWNPIFFHYHYILLALIVIMLLLACLLLFLVKEIKLKAKSNILLLLPYAIWLFIATSLNAYFLLFN